jgi:hypothetical protein
MRSWFERWTNDPSYGNFGAVIGTWKTKVPLRLVDIKERLYLVYGDAFISDSKDLVILPAGTEFRIDHLFYRETSETTFLDVMGSLTSGPYAGKALSIDNDLFAANTVFRANIHHGEQQVRDMMWGVAPDKLTK